MQNRKCMSLKFTRELCVMTMKSDINFEKVYNIWAKQSLEELCLVLKIDEKFEEKLICAFKNDMKNLANFHQSTFESLKIWTFMGSFYAK